MKKILSLLEEQDQLKRSRKYQDADAMRDKLASHYGVTVWDRDRIWTTNPNSRVGGSRTTVGRDLVLVQ